MEAYLLEMRTMSVQTRTARFKVKEKQLESYLG